MLFLCNSGCVLVFVWRCRYFFDHVFGVDQITSSNAGRNYVFAEWFNEKQTIMPFFIIWAINISFSRKWILCDEAIPSMMGKAE